jgi:sodium/hydrogen exchanger 8
VYALGLSGFIEIDTTSPMEPLMFGALISAVDPVATLSIMGNSELNCDPLLYTLVFGESVLNDAVAIVLFKTFMMAYDSGEPFSSSTIPSILANFTGITLGSVFVGVGIGLICSYLCKHTEMHRYPEYEISMLFLFAYGSYSFAESLQLSGIMALFFCGVVLSHYNSYNLSPTSQVTAHNIFKSLSTLCEFFVFLFIGMGVCVGKFKNWNFFFIFLAMIICFIARFFNVFPLSAMANLGRTRIISRKMQCVMWFAGLRGAISFALSQNMPGEHKDLYISTTLSIVIFTTIVCGGLTEPFMNKMGMRITVNSPTGLPVTSTDYEKLHTESDHIGGGDDASLSLANGANGGMDSADAVDKGAGTAHIRGAKGPDRSFFQKFDQDYMSPLFGGPLGGEDGDDTDLHHPTPHASGGDVGTGGGIRGSNEFMTHRRIVNA